MTEITKEELVSLLEKNPQWRFFKQGEEYEYDAKKQQFVWEGWDHYNDTMAKDIISFDSSKSAMKRFPWFQWYKFTLDKNIISFWTKNEWEDKKKYDPFVKFEVLVNVEVENNA